MKSRIVIALEDFLVGLKGEVLTDNLYELDSSNVLLDEIKLRNYTDGTLKLIGEFGGEWVARPGRWCIPRTAHMNAPRLELTYGANTFLSFEILPKDVPDDFDRLARIGKCNAPAASQGRHVQRAVVVVVDRLHNALHNQAILADSFASNGRPFTAEPHVNTYEFNPFNRGDVKRTFNELMVSPIRE